MTPRRGAIAVAAFCALLARIAAASPDVETRVDPTQVTAGESVTLEIRLHGALLDSALDVTPLKSSFEVLDVDRTQHQTVINGQRDASADWTISLLPKSTGSLEIPALQVGSEWTDPVKLDVVASSGTASQAPDGTAAELAAPAFLRVWAERANPYEQERLLVRVRLYAGPNVLEGSLRDLELDGTPATPVGEDRSFREEIGGRSYRGIERTYSLLPEAPGELVVPPITFEGVMREAHRARSRRRFGGFGPSIIDEFFSGQANLDEIFDQFMDRGTRRFAVRSEPLTLQVRPRPDAGKDVWWLPARGVSLSESWQPAPARVHVGEALTRRITLRAQGAGLAQLPPLETPQLEGVKQYAEAPKSSENEKGSVRVQEITVIPTQPGRLELPPIEVAWWDTQADAPRVASLGAQVIDVVGAAAPAEPATPSSAVAPEPARTAAAAPEPSALARASTLAAELANRLLWVGVVALLCAVVAAVAWRLRGRRGLRPAVDVPTRRAAERALRRACRRSDPAAAERALHGVMRARDPGFTRIALESWARERGGDDLVHEVARLQRVRYSADSQDWSGAPLWQAYRAARKHRASRSGKLQRAGLPPLYPGSATAPTTLGEARGAR